MLITTSHSRGGGRDWMLHQSSLQWRLSQALLPLFLLSFVMASLASGLPSAMGDEKAPGAEKGGNDSAIQSSDWHLNTVLSTSLKTPGAAIQIPLEETVEVRGTVFDTDGSPAMGAEVWAASLFAKPPLRERVLTNERGQFLLNLKPLTGKSERWSLSAYKGSKGTGIVGDLGWIKKAGADQPGSLTAQLIERGVVHCRVLEQETGNPIYGARMFLGDGRVFISDTHGQIDIGGLQQGNHRSVVLADRCYRRRFIFDNTLNPDGKLNIYLPKAGRIVGTVVDQDDKPVPYAWIYVLGSGNAMALDGRCSLADDKGHFVWEGVSTDRVLRSIHAGHAGYETDELQTLTVPMDTPLEVRFRLTKLESAFGLGDLEVPQQSTSLQQVKKTDSLAMRNVDGRVIGPDGLPIQGANVRWGATDYEDVRRETTTDENGRFQLLKVPDRDGYITVIGEAFAPQFVKVMQSQSEVEVVLKEGSSIGGQVVTQAGRPISGTHIVPVIASPDPSLCNPLWISERATHSDQNGRFEISGLPATVQFDFLHKQMSELRFQRLEIGRMDHVVELPSRGAFRGRVVDLNGQPVRDFRVMIDFPREKRDGDREASGFDVVVRGIGVSYTNDEGRFAWGDEIEPDATYRVTVASKGYGNAINDRVISTTVDQLAESQEYLFQMQAPHPLTVQVLAESSAEGASPIEGAKVTLVDGGVHKDKGPFTWGSDEIGEVFAITDNGGVAKFVNLPSGEGTLIVQANGFARHRIGWRDSERSFTVRLPKEATIGGVVRSSEGSPMQGLQITLENATGQRDWMSLEHNDLGRFLFKNLTQGTYTLSLRDERRTLHQQEFEVKTGEQSYLAITVNPAAGTVTVIDETPSDPTVTGN